jgi:hypothetical protein
MAATTRREAQAGGPLRSAESAIGAQAEDELMMRLVTLLESETGDRLGAIRKSMSLLERAMESEPLIAGRLMAALYPLANDSFLHEVCDAIEIWFYESRPRELADAFRRKATNDAASQMARKYLEWTSSIESVKALEQGMSKSGR